MANNLPGINASLVAGHFDAYYVPWTSNTYSAPTEVSKSTNLIGQSLDGFNWKRIPHLQPVLVDEAGEVPVNAIQQGVEHFVTLTYVEYAKIKFALEAAVGSSVGATSDASAGRVLPDQVSHELLDYHVNPNAGTLILVPKAGTSAVGDLGSGKALFFPIAVVDTDVDLLLASKLRQGPCAFHCYPEPASGLCWTVAAAPTVS